MEHAQKLQLLTERLRNFLRQAPAEPELFLVSKPENKYYLSLFPSTSYDLLIGKEKSYLLTDFRYEEAAEELADLFEIVITKPGHSLSGFLKEKKIRKLGMEFKETSAELFLKLEENLPEDGVMIPYDGVLESIRSVKDKSELAFIAQAEKIGDQAFSYILDEIRPGVTENEIAVKLEIKMRELGAEKTSFETIVVSGERSSLPHGHPGERRFEKGDFITMDFGCVFRGYCSDMTRTVALGSVSEEQKRVYNIVLQAQAEAAAVIRAGVRAADVDAAARKVIEKEGFGRYFGHGLGHGVGLEIHEAPTANPPSKEILQQGMLLTIEPGIYLPKKFGVRIEDLSIVTENGIINLSGSSKELIVL